MKSSRKGTKLNDAQYFKNPLPHTREKMTVMFLLENISSIKTRYFIDNEDISVNLNSRIKNQGRKINSMEESVEMALVNYDDGLYESNEEHLKGFFRDVFVETNGDLQRGPSESIIITEVKRSDTEVAVDKISQYQKETDLIKNHEHGRERKMNDRRIHHNRDNKRHSSRWRNSWFTQLIINLYSQIMGKSKRKDSMEEEEDIDVTRSRSYLVYRKEDNPIVEEKSREEIVSTFVRQIQRTRDKNLRVMLLQRELQARLPAENTIPSKIYDGKLDSPRLSSPLC